MSDYEVLKKWSSEFSLDPNEEPDDSLLVYFRAHNEIGDVTPQVFQNGWAFASETEAQAEWLDVWEYYTEHPEEIGEKLTLSATLIDGPSYANDGIVIEEEFEDLDWPVTCITKEDFYPARKVTL